MTDNETLNIGDICLYYFNNGNKSLSLVEVVNDHSEEVAVVGFHQVFVDDSGNGLFEYLCKKGKTMMVSKEFLHKVDLANRQAEEIEKLNADVKRLTTENENLTTAREEQK